MYRDVVLVSINAAIRLVEVLVLVALAQQLVRTVYMNLSLVEW
jgi:hypothetical protein